MFDFKISCVNTDCPLDFLFLWTQSDVPEFIAANAEAARVSHSIVKGFLS